jgi:hypothetical protein
MTSIQRLDPNHPWPRPTLLKILETAIQVEDYRFARQVSLAWLAAFPGDLAVSLLRAQALIGEDHTRQALPVLKHLCQTDPEFLLAQEELVRLQIHFGQAQACVSQAEVLALGGNYLSTASEKKALHLTFPQWTHSLHDARTSLKMGKSRAAQEYIHQALAHDPQAPLAAVTHMRILSAQAETPPAAIRSLAEHYQQRWPDCLAFSLFYARALMESGSPGEAVNLLHEAATRDVAGQVASRLWGNDHPYKALWPDQMRAAIDIPIPAGVASVLGWNLLPKGGENGQDSRLDPVSKEGSQPQISSQDTRLQGSEYVPEQIYLPKRPIPKIPSGDPPEELKSIQAQLERLSQRLKKPEMARNDGRFPVYVIFSTRKGLQNKYGRATAAMLDDALRELVAALRNQLDWGALLFYPDDPASMAALELKPVPANDAWELKLALTDLDAALGKKGAMVGAVLIVGGPDVVPFHHLPNPTDDADHDVPSDNPYATRDENYFVPEWPVGRLPGSADGDPGLLLSYLRAMTDRHMAASKNSRSGFLALLEKLISRLFHRNGLPDTSFGYTAEIWRRASISVFRTIGDINALLASPPVAAESLVGAQRNEPLGANLGYFNLHGLPDTAEWYGQRDPISSSRADAPGEEPASDPDYPVALRTSDILNGGKAPQVVFSEACYGTYVFNKKVEDAIALKFLASGSQVVIGSTVISYGSIATPLNAADLLAKTFWNFLNEGFPAGEALRRAKISLAREMHKRQGYIDGEDQKTLISFVLYGDPLVHLKDLPSIRQTHKSVTRSLTPPPQIKTICDRTLTPNQPEVIPEDVMLHVKRIVHQYLPGMENADLCLSHEHAGCCCKGHTCPTGQLGSKTHPEEAPDRSVITLSKSVSVEHGIGKERAKHIHKTYARLTLDKEGKVVKLAVSR